MRVVCDCYAPSVGVCCLGCGLVLVGFVLLPVAFGDVFLVVGFFCAAFAAVFGVAVCVCWSA